jgi:cysteine desulfurase
MGLPGDVSQTAVRFTLGAGTTAAEAMEAAASVRAAVAAVTRLGT